MSNSDLRKAVNNPLLFEDAEPSDSGMNYTIPRQAEENPEARTARGNPLLTDDAEDTLRFFTEGGQDR